MSTNVAMRLFVRNLYLVPLFVIVGGAHSANGLTLWIPDWWGTTAWWLFSTVLGAVLLLGACFALVWVAAKGHGSVAVGRFRPRGPLLASVGTAVGVVSAIGAYQPPVQTWMSFGGILLMAAGIMFSIDDQMAHGPANDEAR